MRERRLWNSLQVAGSTTEDLLTENGEAMAETAEADLGFGDVAARGLANAELGGHGRGRHARRATGYVGRSQRSRGGLLELDA